MMAGDPAMPTRAEIATEIQDAYETLLDDGELQERVIEAITSSSTTITKKLLLTTI